MIRARFRILLRDDIWVKEVTTSFPRATLRLLTGVPTGERALELGEVRADDPEPVVAAIRDHPDVTAFETLALGEDRAVGQYETTERSLYEFLRSLSLPPEFPIVVENGRMEFDTTVTREGFEAVGATLDAGDTEYELLSVVPVGDETTLLTERQRECLSAALRAGYFEVPRRCTLAELADDLGIDKSTASETIRRGTASVMEAHLLDSA